MSSVITISQPPDIPDGDKGFMEPSEGITFAPAPNTEGDSDNEYDDNNNDNDSEKDTETARVKRAPSLSGESFQSQSATIVGGEDSGSDAEGNPGDKGKQKEKVPDVEKEEEEKKRARVGSLEKLQGTGKERERDVGEGSNTREKMTLHPVSFRPRRISRVPEAIIVLKEEKVGSCFWSVSRALL